MKRTAPTKINKAELQALSSVLVERATLMSRLGMSYGTTRDIYTALGYVKAPVFEDYYARYKRQDIAKRIVTAYPKACWRKKPIITETEDKETEFEKKWAELVTQRKVLTYLSRIDVISGIGQYGVLLLGFDDGKLAEEPVESASELLYLKPFMQSNADIVDWEVDIHDERYGLPKVYQLQASTANQVGIQSQRVHYSRVLHIAEEPGEDDVYGTPRLESVLNRLQDLELVAGGSSEMFWRGAFPGYGFKADEKAQLTAQSFAALQDEIEEYLHGLKRYIRTQGFDIENMSVQVADPKSHVNILLDLIAGATGIPKRILVGSERGELASSQDEKAWNDRIDERRKDHVENNIVRPFVDKLIQVGVLPEPADNYSVDWPAIHVMSDKEQAEVSGIKTEALTKYAMSPGADMIVPPEIFLQRFLGFTKDEVEQMMDLSLQNAGD